MRGKIYYDIRFQFVHTLTQADQSPPVFLYVQKGMHLILLLICFSSISDNYSTTLCNAVH